MLSFNQSPTTLPGGRRGLAPLNMSVEQASRRRLAKPMQQTSANRVPPNERTPSANDSLLQSILHSSAGTSTSRTPRNAVALGAAADAAMRAIEASPYVEPNLDDDKDTKSRVKSILTAPKSSSSRTVTPSAARQWQRSNCATILITPTITAPREEALAIVQHAIETNPGQRITHRYAQSFMRRIGDELLQSGTPPPPQCVAAPWSRDDAVRRAQSVPSTPMPRKQKRNTAKRTAPHGAWTAPSTPAYTTNARSTPASAAARTDTATSASSPATPSRAPTPDSATTSTSSASESVVSVSSGTASAERAQRRTKQIEFGKATIGYALYSEKIPREQRTAEHPMTPRVGTACSKRSWDGKVREWRRKLHEFDPSSDDEWAEARAKYPELVALEERRMERSQRKHDANEASSRPASASPAASRLKTNRVIDYDSDASVTITL